MWQPLAQLLDSAGAWICLDLCSGVEKRFESRFPGTDFGWWRLGVVGVGNSPPGRGVERRWSGSGGSPGEETGRDVRLRTRFPRLEHGARKFSRKENSCKPQRQT